MEPKYAELLGKFKADLYSEEENPRRASEANQLNRTLSLLGKEFGELRNQTDLYDRPVES